MDEKVRDIKNRIIRMKLVDGTTINGQVNINKEHGYDRLSDLVGSQTEQFIILNGATVWKEDLENPVKHPVFFVNKRYIMWCAPDEEQN